MQLPLEAASLFETTASVARRGHRSTNPGFWAHLEQRRKEKAGERNLSPRLKGGVPETINAGKKKREPHKSEVRALGAAACRLKSVDKKDTCYKRGRQGKRKSGAWNANCVQAPSY